MASIGAIFTSMAKLISQSCGELQPAVYFSRGDWVISRPTEVLVDVWQAWETSHSKSSLDNFQHKYLAELLGNVYSYHSILKTVSCCCVCGRWIFLKSSHILCMFLVYLLARHTILWVLWSSTKLSPNFNSLLIKYFIVYASIASIKSNLVLYSICITICRAAMISLAWPFPLPHWAFKYGQMLMPYVNILGKAAIGA